MVPISEDAENAVVRLKPNTTCPAHEAFGSRSYDSRSYDSRSNGSRSNGSPTNGSRGRTPEELAAAEQLRRDIRRAIAGLSPKLRDALLLAQTGDYTYEEIGVMADAPIGTIKWRVSEARRVLRLRLHERGHCDV